MIKILHRYLGLLLLLPTLASAFTGVILVVYAMQKPSFVVKVQDAEAVIMAFAEVKPSFISFKGGIISRGKGGRFQLLEDGTLKRVQKGEFEKFIQKLHDTFFLPNGRSVNGIFGLFLLLLVITGFVRWFKMIFLSKATAVHNLKMNAKLALKPSLKKAFFMHFHAFFGFLFGLVFVVIFFSGVSIAFPQQVKGFLSKILPSSGEENAFEFVEGSYTLKDVINMERFAGYKLTGVEMPSEKNNNQAGVFFQNSTLPLIVRLQENGIIIENHANYSIAKKVFLYQSLIHKGHLGLLWNLVQFASGFALILIAFSGFIFWLVKRKSFYKSS